MTLKNDFATRLPALSSACLPQPAEQPSWIYFNSPLAIDLDIAQSDDWLDALSGGTPPPGSQPIAAAYSGHQFGQFNPGLGDGRAHLLGEIETPAGLIDLALKGSGRTPYSRAGDGRASLGPMLREVLISEHLHALGIPTTRSLSVTATGETVWRQQPEPGAVLARTAASHIRVGSFEHLAARQQHEDLKQLYRYTCERHYPDIDPDDHMAFLAAVCERQAALIAQWMSVGFVHGVMNTDNMTLSGESIDFGPCAFMDGYDPNTVFSSIDRNGRYRYIHQPSIAQWNLTRLAETLLPLMQGEIKDNAELAKAVLNRFPAIYQDRVDHLIDQKLGTQDEGLRQDFLQLLQDNKADWTLAFYRLSEPQDWLSLFTDQITAQQWHERWIAATPHENRPNPAVIARNHLVDQALKDAQGGDMRAFNTLLAELTQPHTPSSRPQAHQPADASFAAGFQTFCGT